MAGGYPKARKRTTTNTQTHGGSRLTQAITSHSVLAMGRQSGATTARKVKVMAEGDSLKGIQKRRGFTFEPLGSKVNPVGL